MRTKIKQAHWKSKSLFGKVKPLDEKYMNIVTTVYSQGKKIFIDSDSKFLFQMICENFFHQYPNIKLQITLESFFGALYPATYRLYVYNVIYKELTGKKVKNDIFEVKKAKELFYRSKLDIHTKEHKKMVLKIIEILEIDFKKESAKASRILFNMKKKKDFYLTKENMSL